MRHLAGSDRMEQPISNLTSLYAALYAKEFPAQALLRLRPELRNQPCAVMQGEPPLKHVCAMNSHARKLGVAPGMTQVEMDTFPLVTLLPRSIAEEAAARTVLLETAAAFSPRVEQGNVELPNEDQSSDDNFLCVICLAGTEKLFGKPHKLAAALLKRVKALEITASIAVSVNFHAAICAARGATHENQITVIPPGEESPALARLPLSVLDLSLQQAETFSLWGIRTLGMLAALPEKSLIARMGQEGKRLSQLAKGECPHLFLPIEPAFKLEEHMELDTPVDILVSLLFVIGIMLEQLVLRASAHALAIASIAIVMTLEDRSSHSRTVRPAVPSNDRQLWLKLIRLDLEADPPHAAILTLIVSAEPGRVSKVQLGLFSPQLPEPMRLDVTMARIRAIVGENNAGCAVLSDTHQPDSFRLVSFSVPPGSATKIKTNNASGQSKIALRQLRPPESAVVTLCDDRPSSFFFRKKHYEVECAYGPWLKSGEWWNPALWQWEEWDLAARSRDGMLLHCCLVRDLKENRWHLAAFYD